MFYFVKLFKGVMLLYNYENYDSVTGLPLRVDFINSFDISKYSGQKPIVLLLRVNTLDSLTENLDYSAANEILRQISTQFTTLGTKPDSICKYTHNEFLIVLSNIGTYVDLYNYINTIIEKCTNPISVKNKKFHITINIGISLWSDNSKHLLDLIYKADIALSQSQWKGENSFHIFNSNSPINNSRLNSIYTGLQNVLSKKELYVVFQPKVSAQDGIIVGFEALARWQHPTLGEIPPIEFIPIAENTGMIIPIGLFVFEQSCKRCRQLIDLGYQNLKFSINVSKVQIQDENIVFDFMSILDKYDLNPKYIELELTENIVSHVAMKDMAILQQFKKLGFSIALDDFGIGSSSFQYLKALPIDTLKIDKSFINDIGINPKVDSIIQCLITMSHQLKILVVAEGVETSTHVNFLKELACDIFQGYYYSKPILFEEVIPLLQ